MRSESFVDCFLRLGAVNVPGYLDGGIQEKVWLLRPWHRLLDSAELKFFFVQRVRRNCRVGIEASIVYKAKHFVQIIDRLRSRSQVVLDQPRNGFALLGGPTPRS